MRGAGRLRPKETLQSALSDRRERESSELRPPEVGAGDRMRGETGAKARRRGPHKMRNSDVRVPGTLRRVQRKAGGAREPASGDVPEGTEAGRAEGSEERGIV